MIEGGGAWISKAVVNAILGLVEHSLWWRWGLDGPSVLT